MVLGVPTQAEWFPLSVTTLKDLKADEVRPLKHGMVDKPDSKG